MSTIKTTNITHGSNTGTANIVLDSSGNATINGNLSVTGTGAGLPSGLTYGSSTFAVTGKQTISAQPAFRASLTSNVSATNTIVFNSQQYEQGGDNYDPTTGIYTCPVAGLYMFIAQCTSTNHSGGRKIVMYKNADAIGRLYAGNNTNDHLPMPLSIVQSFAANDTCLVKCEAGTIYGSTGSESQYSQFMGYLLG